MAGTLGEESNKIHQDSDVDNSVVALHHTLGRSATQAAAGNHNHDTSYSELTHSHEDLSGSDHLHSLGTLNDVVLNAPETTQFLGYGADGNWTNEDLPTEAHAQLGTAAPVPRGLGDLWVKTDVDLLSWDDAWTIPPLLNSWVAYGGAHVTPRYRKLPGGLVIVEGLARGGVAVSTIFTLPTGYRPSGTLIMTQMSSPEVAARIDVYSTGEVKVTDPPGAGPTTYLTLNFSFYADA